MFDKKDQLLAVICSDCFKESTILLIESIFLLSTCKEELKDELLPIVRADFIRRLKTYGIDGDAIKEQK